MRLSRLAVALYVGLVFVSGVLVGGLGYRLYSIRTVSAKAATPTPADFRRSYLNELHTRLKTTPDQGQKINDVLVDIGNQFDQMRKKMRSDVWDQMRPDRERLHSEQIDRINAILTPTQQAEYKAMRDERTRQHQQEQREKQQKRDSTTPTNK